MKKFSGPMLAAALLILLLAPQARAGFDEALSDCRHKTDLRRQYSGCTQLIEKYSGRSNMNLGAVYYARAYTKVELEHSVDSVNSDFERSCDLGYGPGCCEMAVWYFDIAFYEDDKSAARKVKQFLRKADKLGYNEKKCEELFDSN